MIRLVLIAQRVNRRYLRQSLLPVAGASSPDGRRELALRRAARRKALQAAAAQRALEEAQASSGRAQRQLAALRRSLRGRGH